MNSKVLAWVSALAMSVVVAGCGGGGGDSPSTSQALQQPQGGTQTYELTTLVDGSGSVVGDVTSSSTCTGNGSAQKSCKADVTASSDVTLTATASTGYTFSGWTGSCTGKGSCKVNMNGSKSVGATFSPNVYLSVTGRGTVSSSPTGLACDNGTSPCTLTATSGSSYTLSVTPAAGYAFSGWTGDCSGTGACSFTADAAKTMSATFVATTQPLTLTLSGNGTVASAPAGVSCTTSCAPDLTAGATYTLTATPSTGYTFAGWGGACSGTGACAVTMSQAQTVTANFTATTALTKTLSLTMSGSGTVSSSPAGVNCTATCAPGLTTGASYTLTATPAAGYAFSAWGGACSGSGSCAVTMGSNQAVSATFVPTVYTLGLTVSGSGSVSSAPAGVSCTGSCTPSLTANASYTLTATPATGYSFAGWSGACTGTGNCAVTMAAAKTVTATFTANKTLTLTISGSSGTVTSAPAGVSCTSNCTPSLTSGASYTLTAVPATGYVFSGWSGGSCSGTGTCAVTMSTAQAVTASFTTATKTLSLVLSGSGTVTSSPARVSCSASCSPSLTTDSSYTLTATPATGHVFAGWTGACSGTGACAVTMNASKSVIATFTPVNTLTLTIAGNGTVASSPSGVSCSASCAPSLTSGSAYTLTATPATGYVFTGWTGACSGTGTCAVTMSSAQSVTATFAALNTLTLTFSGNGTVSSAPAGVSCTASCAPSLVSSNTYVLTATPATGYLFTGWSGACSGTSTCSVPMSAAKAVTATFTPANTLTLTLSGNGAVSSAPAAVSCTASCSTNLIASSTYVLTATPATGYVFTGWSGACSGTGTCSANMSAARAVTAVFTPANTLTLTLSGSGSVVSSPSGVSCTANCSTSLVASTTYVLTATPASGYGFTGWGGACSGTGTCTVSMATAKSVTASFALQTYSLGVGITGNGSVTSSTGGISCVNGSSGGNTGTCTAAISSGTNVTLTAAPATGYAVASWSGGGCSGTGATCTVPVSAATTVSLIFTPSTYPLSAGVSGSGTVTSSTGGISCATGNTGTCSANIASGTSVTLTATAASGYTFTGWSGSCSGTGTCSVSMASSASVTATFTQPTYALSLSVTGSGTVTSSAGGSCATSACTLNVAQGASVTLTASASSGYSFTGWGGACSGSATTCTVAMSAARSVTATFGASGGSTACVIPRGTATSPTYASSHPKIFLNHAATLSCLQQQLSAGGTAATRFKTIVDTELNASATSSAYTWSSPRVYLFESWYAALMYRVTGNTQYADLAVSRVEAMVASEEALINNRTRPGVTYDSYLEIGDYISNVALVYDWCFDRLTAGQKTRWVSYMNQAVRNVWNQSSATWSTSTTAAWSDTAGSNWAVNDPYNNYYYSFLRATMLLGLATAGESSDATTWLNQFRTTKFANQLLPAFNADLVGGGSQEGTGYGTSLKVLFQLYDWWERSTGERIATLTQHTEATLPWMMHNITPTLNRLIATGDHARDSSASLFDYHREMLLSLISLFPTSNTSTIAKSLLDSSSVPTMANSFEAFADYLYQPPSLPAASVTDMSTAYWAYGTGQLLMRSAWGDTTAAHAQLSCGPLLQSHAHQDQGSFQIFRREWLAPTSNIYSHSGINSNESMNNLVRFLNSSGSIIAQAKYFPVRCNLAALDNNDSLSYTYALAQVTPIYNSNALIQKSEREFLFIKPGVFIVFDRAASSTGTSRVWTLNTPGVPTVSGDNLSYVGTNSRMDVYRVAPTGLSYSVNVPTPDTGNGDTINNANARRIDVVSNTGTQTNFLHVISTSANTTASSVSSAVADLSVSGMTGVQVTLADGRVVIVRFSNTGTGGTLEIRNSSGTVLRSGALATTLTAPPVLR